MFTPLRSLFIHPAPLSGGVYAATPYMASSSAGPVRWNPCNPIKYQLNLTGAPASARTDILSAIGELSHYTHLDFVYDGTTKAVPQSNWAASYDGTSTPPPVVIAFANKGQSDILNHNSELAVGSGYYISQSGINRYVTGSVVIDRAAAAATPAGVGSGQFGMLILHELSHVVGLAHSHNPASYMYPWFAADTQSVTPADAAHLAVLGAGSC